MEKPQPKPVQKFFCPQCGELMAKIYPYSSLVIPAGAKLHPCPKCIYENQHISHKNTTRKIG